MTLWRCITITAAAVTTALALAGPASADSISFLRGGDIWVASPDGANQVQITRGGGYSYQSQADDGTFIALAGRRLRRISRGGEVLADFSTPVSAEKVDDKTSYFMGPFDPEISPDGSRVVYSYLWQDIFNKPGCTGPNWLCQDRHLYQGVAYSHADRMTGWSEPGFGKQSGWVHPSWMGNDRVVTSAPSEPLNNDVMFDDVGSDNNDIHDWFSDGLSAGVNDGEVNRQGTMAAFLTSDTYNPDAKSSRVTLYRMPGPAPAVPEQCSSIGFASGSYEGPTWAPSGERIAFVDRAGDETGRILVADVPGCVSPAPSPRIVIEDARHPDWGPAPVPNATPPATPRGAGAPTAVKPAIAARTLTLRGRNLRRALRQGVQIRYAAPGRGRLDVRALRSGRTVARGTATASSARTVTARLRFTARARREFRRRASVSLTVQTTFRQA